ncbi:MAG TPA: class E sortase [Actinomycetota bacterium]|nr:class E sortase [Actinomycetota bacterium]
MSPSLSPRSRRLTSRLLTAAAVVAIVTGVVLIGHPYYTDLQAKRTQSELSDALEAPGTREAYEAKEIREAHPVTRLRIPKLNVDTVVVEGTSKEALDAGAGHYSSTPLPGSDGNVGIAGHRTTYGKPFENLDLLQPGDQVELDTPVGPYVYEMVEPFDGHANPWVIEPDDWSVVDPTDEPMLTLTTCHPKRSAAQRLVARLKLVSSPSEPVGA